MSDYLELGPVPCEENCQPVGMPEYDGQMARRELNVYKYQLERMFPLLNFGVKWFPHDFGSYGEVVAYWNDEEEMEAVYDIEDKLPMKWDLESRKELGLNIAGDNNIE